VTITLKRDKWTKIYQSFTTREKKLYCSITFTLSSDYQVEHDSEPPISGLSLIPGLDDIPGVRIYDGSSDGSWMLTFAQGWWTSPYFLHPDEKKKDPQTLTGLLRLNTDADTEMYLILAFPPGEGAITITNISLSPDNPND
jgi:hypothetical protein